MKQLFATAFLASVALFGLNSASQASGCFRSCRGGCDTGCAPACAPAAPVEVKYEERKVKVAKAVWREKEVEVLECKRVMKEERYTYTVCIPVTKEEKRKVIVCTPTMREEKYTCTVMVPRTEQREITCTTYKCERVMVTEQVPVCRTVCVTYVDECGRCCTKRERVSCMEERTRCVVKRTPITEKRMVNVTVCVPEKREGVRTVCDMVRTEKDVTVQVCSYDMQKKEGVRTVCSYETNKVKRMVKYCETVWEEQTVRVAVCPAASCDTGCGHGRTGLFRRGGCCN